MKYSDLVKVLAIYEEHSFTTAAKRLYISQPALSQNIAQLEREFGLLLFVRENGQIRPTEACEVFVSHARKIQEAWRQLETDMHAMGVNDFLRIGTTSFFFRFLSNRTATLFAGKELPFQYNIIEDSARNIERMTSEGNLDFCFTRAPLYYASLRSEPLFTEEIYLVLPESHPCCSEIDEKDKTLFPYVDLERFRENNFVMVNNPRITPLCLQMCSNAGYKPRISLQPSTWEHVIMGVRSGNGVGFLSNLHIGRDNSEGLRFFRIPSELAKLQHVVAWRPSYTFSPGARTFIDSFRSYVESNLQVLTQHDHRSN